MMITELCTALGVDSEDVLGRSRKKEISLARSVYFWWMYKNGFNYSQIGKLCDRNHATVIHAVKSIDGAIDVNDPLIMPLVEKVRHIKNEVPAKADSGAWWEHLRPDELIIGW